jgi:D-glycero-D-manno-heptose 1,7-bisphosphate phosphatase
MQNKALLLDRDGTINVDTGYLYKMEDWRFQPMVVEAIKAAKNAGYMVIVITNQSGVARGYYSEKDIELLHDQVNESLREQGTCIDAFYYCPHHKGAAVEKYAVDCECRKPRLGLYRQAIEAFNLDPKLCAVAGDKLRDIERVNELGIEKVGLIDYEGTGKGYSSLYEFVMKVLEKENL